MFVRSFPGMFALRYPFFAPDDDLGGGEGDIDPAFVEQPGDRLPEPDAGDPDPDPAPDAEPSGDADPDPAGDADPDPEPDPAGEGDPDPEADPDPDPDAEPDPKPKKDWRDRQIIKARAAEKAAREASAAKDAEIAELKARLEGDGGDGTPLTEADRTKLREEALATVRKEQRFKTINERCDAMFDAGAKAFPKTWEASVAAVGEVFGDEIVQRPDFLEAVTDLDNAAAVYHDLASDPDKMEAVLALPPHKMGMELARISARLAQAPRPKAVSKVPPPIKPLDGPTLQERSLDDLASDPSPGAMAEFDRRMAAEEKKRYGTR